MLHYEEFLPHPALRPYINLYGILEEDTIYEEWQIEKNPPVINKGLMFHYRRDAPLIIENQYWQKGEISRGFLMAQGVSPNIWRYKGGFGIFAVVFKPGMFRFFYPDSMLEFMDSLITFADYSEQALRDVHEKIALAQSHETRIKLVDDYLLTKIRDLQPTQDWLQCALQQMYIDPKLKIKDIEYKVRVSEKHFRNEFSRAFGIRPKDMQQLMRLTHAINAMKRQPDWKLKDIAWNSGFSNPPHFNRVFKVHTGITPRTFRLKQTQVAHFITHHDEVQYRQS